VLSVASVRSCASIGSVGSFGSVLSIGSSLSVGSVLSSLSRSSLMSRAAHRTVLGCGGRANRQVGSATAGLLAAGIALVVYAASRDRPAP
jgi:hypothetical protein